MTKMSVLVIEDNADKLASIVQLIESTIDPSQVTITHCFDINSAKTRMRSELFDLLVVDVAVPAAIGIQIQGREGIELIEEITKRKGFKIPGHIVALSAYANCLEELRVKLTYKYITSILFNPATNEWSQRLSEVTNHILAAKQSTTEPSQYQTFLSIICALQSPELDSILSLDWSWQVIAFPNDDTIYHRGLINKGDESFIVHAAAAARMGMPASAVLSSKMARNFKPRYLAMTGITAGVKDKTQYGDVLLADPSWDWGSGKWKTSDKRELTFAQAPFQLPVDAGIRNKVELIRRETRTLADIREAWPGDKPDSILSVRVGPVASGASVLAEGLTVERLRSEQHKELLGIEMETYAVYVAAMEALNPRPLAFSLKSVVDFADGEKNDKYQKYGAYTSARILKLLAEEYLD